MMDIHHGGEFLSWPDLENARHSVMKWCPTATRNPHTFLNSDRCLFTTRRVTIRRSFCVLDLDDQAKVERCCSGGIQCLSGQNWGFMCILYICIVYTCILYIYMYCVYMYIIYIYTCIHIYRYVVLSNLNLG